MSASDPGLRRVTVHAGSAVADLALPATVPIGTLIPSIVDIVQNRGPDTSGRASRYQLSQLGSSALPKSTTLAQNDIQDGAVLVLSRFSPAPPAPRHHDTAAAVSATLEASAPPRRVGRLTAAVAASCLTGTGGLTLIRNTLHTNVSHQPDTAMVAALAGFTALLFAVVAGRSYRDPLAGLTLSVIATAFAAIAGFLALPGPPGLPNVLLASMTAAVMSVLAMRATGCDVVALTSVSCSALIIAVAALSGVITATPVRAVAAVTALVTLALLGAAPRASIMLAGLSPKPGIESVDCVAAKAIRADDWLTTLVGAFASCAAAGAITTAVTGVPRPGCIAFAAAVGLLLLLRARGAGRCTLIFVVSGMATAGTTFAVAGLATPQHGPWIASATAVLTAVVVCLGFGAPAISPSPVVRRGIDLLECAALVSMVPLACWLCGIYHTVRSFVSA